MAWRLVGWQPTVARFQPVKVLSYPDVLWSLLMLLDVNKLPSSLQFYWPNVPFQNVEVVKQNINIHRKCVEVIQNLIIEIFACLSLSFAIAPHFVFKVCKWYHLSGRFAFAYIASSLIRKDKGVVDFCVYLHKLIAPFMFINFNWSESKKEENSHSPKNRLPITNRAHDQRTSKEKKAANKRTSLPIWFAGKYIVYKAL